MAVLLWLGAVIERTFGTTRYVLVFLAAALGGSVSSMLFSKAALNLGISNAESGLLGAWALVVLLFRNVVPEGMRLRPIWWLVLFGCAGWLTFDGSPGTDWASHVGGFVGGTVMVLLLYGTAAGVHAGPTRLTKAATAALLVTFAAALAMCVHYATGNADYSRDLARARLDHPRVGPQAINEMSWAFAIDPRSSPAVLLIARDAIGRARADRPDDTHFVDTLATIYHRLGDDARAFELECEALRLERSDARRRLYESQLARFLLALNRGKDDVRAPAARLVSTGEETHLEPAVSGPAHVHAFALIEGTRPGLLEIDGDAAAPMSAEVVSALRSGAPLPRDLPLACVEWREATLSGASNATFEPLDKMVADWP